VFPVVVPVESKGKGEFFMGRNFIVIAFFLGGSIAVLHGILMLVTPGRHRRFLAWIGGMGAWSDIFNSTIESGLELQRRLAGLGLAVIGIYFIWFIWKG
jgi:uncharacterized protein YjeT (DUF2065 family)